MADEGEVIDRSGGGRFVETYPAAALAIWGLPSKGYKGEKKKATAVRAEIVDGLAGKLGAGLILSEEVSLGSLHV